MESTTSEVPQKLKIDLSYNLALPHMGIYPKEYKSGYNRDTCTLVFTAALSQEPSCGNSPDALQLMNVLRKCGTYTPWIIIQP
jgi:hypothetical protein